MIKKLAVANLIVVCSLGLSPAQAIEFEYAGTDFTWLNTLTAGATLRSSERDIGKICNLDEPGTGTPVHQPRR